MNMEREKRCPDCGMTIGDFHRTGLFGCASCYKVFREEVRETVKRVQGRTRHTGNAPAPEAENKYVLLIEQDMLLESLSRALAEGKLRDADKFQHRLEEIKRLLHPEEPV